MLRTKTMQRQLPMSVIWKIDKYDIKFEGEKVDFEVDVLDSSELVSSAIVHDLIPKLPQNSPPVVGMDLYSSKNGCWGRSTNSLLVLCIDEYCLIVQLKHLDKIPDYLKRFLGDERYCFVGVDVDQKLSHGMPSSLSPLDCKTALELSCLAARIRKKPSLLYSDLKALAAECEVLYDPPASGVFCSRRINYEARVFSKDGVKALVHDAYYCHKIAKKLVNALLRDEASQGNFGTATLQSNNSGNAGTAASPSNNSGSPGTAPLE